MFKSKISVVTWFANDEFFSIICQWFTKWFGDIFVKLQLPLESTIYQIYIYQITLFANRIDFTLRAIVILNVNSYIHSPTYDLIIFFNSHRGLNISTEVEIFPPRLKYFHRGLNICTPV